MEHLDEEHPLHVLFLQPRGLIHQRQRLVDSALAALDFNGWVLCPTDTKLKSLRLGRIDGAKIFER
jgi:hypothetical protein